MVSNRLHDAWINRRWIAFDWWKSGFWCVRHIDRGFHIRSTLDKKFAQREARRLNLELDKEAKMRETEEAIGVNFPNVYDVTLTDDNRFQVVFGSGNQAAVFKALDRYVEKTGHTVETLELYTGTERFMAKAEIYTGN